MPKRPPETIESLERKIAAGFLKPRTAKKLYEVYTAHGCRTDSTGILNAASSPAASGWIN